MQVEPHNQPSSNDGQPARGLTPLDGPTQARLRQVRWREPLQEQHWRVLALVVAMLLHVLFVLVIWGMMRPPASVPAQARPEQVLQVRFITNTPATLPPPPPPLALPPPPSAPHVLPKPREPVSKEAMTLQVPTPTPKPADTVQPYNTNDVPQPQLPASGASAPTPGYVQNLPKGDTQIMQHDDPVTYQATRFDKDWGKGNMVDNALQKIVDKTTVKKTIRLPGGVRIHCAVSLAMLAGGCGGDPPPPPSAKDGDERLSMAATPLASDPKAAKLPSVEACIALYRAGKPLAWGCPVDTPNRAIDAELRDRAAGAAHAASAPTQP